MPTPFRTIIDLFVSSQYHITIYIFIAIVIVVAGIPVVVAYYNLSARFKKIQEEFFYK